MMQILRFSGIALLITGLVMIAATMIIAKRKGTFGAIKELRRIRTNGYIREHEAYTGEDVYRNELSSSHARLMSRRAKRVLEKMEQENAGAEKNSKEPGGAGPEDVSVKEEGLIADGGEGTLSLRDGSEGTEILPASGDCTAVLKAEAEGTDILTVEGESTAALSAGEEKTGTLRTGIEKTGVLPTEGEFTDILKEDCGEVTGIIACKEEY